MKTGKKTKTENDRPSLRGFVIARNEATKQSIFNFQFSTLLLMVAIAVSCSGKGNRAKTDGDASTDQSSESVVKVSDAEKKIPFERGSYVEESTTMGIELKKTVYFDRWGDWTASEDKSEMTIMGHTIKTHKIEIVKGGTHWEIDMIEKTARRFELNIPPGIAAALGAALGGKMMEGMEIKELGEENYLGYNCKKTQVKYSQMNMEVTTLTYGNLTMKTEGNMGGMNISSRITSIDLSAPPASIFEVPEGVEILMENGTE